MKLSIVFETKTIVFLVRRFKRLAHSNVHTVFTATVYKRFQLQAYLHAVSYSQIVDGAESGNINNRVASIKSQGVDSTEGG